MSAVDVMNKEGKKHQYKDYVTFLGNYKNGKKDDQCSDSGVSFSLTNSSNNSSSSINSDLNEQPKKSFKEYMESYNNKKYSSVQPSFMKKENKILKSEVYIEINNAHNSVSKVSKVFQVPQIIQQHNNVNKVSKILEKDVKSSVSKVNEFKSEHNGQEEQKKVSIGEISKKFEENSIKNKTAIEPTKQTLKKKPSISKMSKVFEDNSNPIQNNHKKEIEVKNTLFNEASQVFKQKEENKVQKTLNIIKPPPPPPIPMLLQTPPQINVIPPSKCPSPAPPESGCLPPPPPPPMPNNFSSKITSSPPKVKITPKIQNGYSTLPRMTNGKEVDAVDAPKLDKNDPRVKKLVYGALREMYGAYHDKANDYLATLPKNRVKKNNGLDSIINSIASQGGLEKLNGRVNPKSENE